MRIPFHLNCPAHSPLSGGFSYGQCTVPVPIASQPWGSGKGQPVDAGPPSMPGAHVSEGWPANSPLHPTPAMAGACLHMNMRPCIPGTPSAGTATLWPPMQDDVDEETDQARAMGDWFKRHPGTYKRRPDHPIHDPTWEVQPLTPNPLPLYNMMRIVLVLFWGGILVWTCGPDFLSLFSLPPLPCRKHGA